MTQYQSATLDGLPKRFVTAMRTLFDILDDDKTGCVRFSDIQQWWQDDGSKGLPKGVLESLQKVTPPSGLLTFERFCAGLKICLLRNQAESQKTQKTPPSDLRKPMPMRPPSAPSLDNADKPPWSNTATVRPNNALASRTASMPQLLPEPKENYPIETEGAVYPPPMPYYVRNPGAPTMYGPPKPPRSAAAVERPLIERNSQERPLDRVEIRTALHNWQKGFNIPDNDLNKAYIWGRSSGDGKPAGITDAPPDVYKKPGIKKREPRRHTLQNGIDYNMLKRIKHIEKEKDMLVQGLAAVERTREWYLKQIAVVQEKMKYLGRAGSHAEPWSEAQAERLELQKARVLEVNRHLAALTESWERGGLPLHMNLAVHHLASSDLSRVKHQNRLLTKEVSEKSERITALEQEKTGLIRELFQIRSRFQSRPPMQDMKLHDRVGFM